MTELTFSYQSIIVEQQQSVLRVWFNSPENRNALSAALMADVLHLLNSVRDNHQIRAIIFRGKGGTFCAGGDIKSFKSDLQSNTNLDEVAQANGVFGEFISTINQQPQVVIMLVEGAAFGGGLGLACASDVTIVTADAKFRLSETSLGIIPAQILPFVTERIGLTQSRRIMLTGAKFKGAEAVQLGIAHQLATNVADMEQQCEALLKDIALCAPNANRVTKSLLFTSLTTPKPEIFDVAAKAFAQCISSDEGREGISAFIEKRAANWNVLV